MHNNDGFSCDKMLMLTTWSLPGVEKLYFAIQNYA